jgi:amino acid transporter
MTAATVLSLRGLPMMAKEELTLFFYIIFAVVFFLIPASLVSAELGSAFADQGGGVYTWVKEAFNEKLGFVAIFLQWVQNVVWYPSVLGFAVAAISYMVGAPQLAQNGKFVGFMAITLFWFATWMSSKGTRFVSSISSKGFLVGTVLPGIVIITMAIIWLATGNPDAIQSIPASVTEVVSVDAANHIHPRFFPHITKIGDIVFLSSFLLLFSGVEVNAVHVLEMQNPRTQFPKAIFLAALIAVIVLTFGSLAIAVVVPYNQINLQAGLLETFQDMFTHYHIGWATNIMGLLITFGVLAGVMSWISGPSRGLLWTARDGQLPKFLTKTNSNGIQVNILLVQGAIVTVLASLYIFMSDVSVALFLLGAMIATLYFVMYMLMYAAGIKLRYTQPNLARVYKVPGGKIGMWLVAGIGFLATVGGFFIIFFPPTQLPVGSPTFYTMLVLIGTIVFLAAPFIISALVHRKK